MWNLVSVLLDIALILMQDRCIVCPEHTIGSEIFLKHPMKLQGYEGHVEPHFGLFGAVLVSVQDRCMICIEHTTGSEIVLDAPDGTPRSCGSCGTLFWSVWRQC
jgi:hypothetical protein